MSARTQNLLVLFLLGAICATAAFAQPINQTARRVQSAAALPLTCFSSTGVKDMIWQNTASLNVCTAANTWTALATVAGTVPTTRTISTTAPLGGGGDLSADRTLTCTTCATSASTLQFFAASSLLAAPFGSQGTTTTVLHGSAAGAFSFGSIVSADLNITSSTCTNQFLSALSSAAAGTCTTDTLASAQHANQGTTTTLLHGNAAGNPAWGSVVDADLSLTAPALGAPTAATFQTTSNIGLGLAKSATVGQWITAGSAANQADIIAVQNTDAADTGAEAQLKAIADTANLIMRAHGTGRTVSRFGSALGGWDEILASTGSGLKFGTLTTVPLIGGTNATRSFTVDGTSQALSFKGTTTNDNAIAGDVGQFITAVCPGPATTATITVTIASPAVVTWTSHPFSGTAPRFDACPVVFTTSGALPTGITSGTNYWVIPTTVSGNNFSIATSVANAIAATAVNTSGSQSGTQTGTAGTVLSTGATKDVTGFALTAGDWDCSGAADFQFGATTSYTNLTGSISTTAATLGGQDTGFDFETPAAVPTAGADMTWRLSDVRQLLSGTTNVFLVTQGTFTLSTLKTYGTFRCRRMR